MDKQTFLQQLKDQPFSVLSELVYQYIIDAIVDAKYAPGSRINTKRIAEELGISRTPVRTALEQLVKEKLVEQSGEKGFRVCSVDWQDCIALYDIREMLEGNAAYIAANTITHQQLDALKQTIAQYRKACAEGNSVAAFEADSRFHEVVVVSTGNNYLIDMYRSLKIWIRRYRYALLSSQQHNIQDDRRIIEEHIVIYRALKSRYSLVAKAEMERHLHRIYRVLFDRGSSLTESEEH